MTDMLDFPFVPTVLRLRVQPRHARARPFAALAPAKGQIFTPANINASTLPRISMIDNDRSSSLASPGRQTTAK
jgi:hypothetical protein